MRAGPIGLLPTVADVLHYADVQARVSDLSIELAERIVQQNLDRATQIQLIENYINEVGGTRR